MWIYWYLMKFAGESPFGISGACMKTYAWSVLNGNFREVSKRKMPKRWFDPFPHTHIALDDAIEQGATFINILREARKLPKIDQILSPPIEQNKMGTPSNQIKQGPKKKQRPTWLINDNFVYYYMASPNFSK
eukprot:TRINITY_DN3676_c0_g1_i3.p1 TRINITY_DN3676_c0_g1~~TRINITY_DN3676_c0_g1_i3.p1  ORF type:complete len:132 (-),score=24.43 TRINITY_DN3676_c0_g1_i3:73-468(-)